MNIVIIGWYGTETIGDRAILASLLTLINNKYKKCNFCIGSLYPFFTERTINEDKSLYNVFSDNEFEIQIFNSKNVRELDNYIEKSDLVIMGGGPLMHIEEMRIVEYAFKKAKKRNKKTVIAGCGVGPIFNDKYEKILINIMNLSDVIILRDGTSKRDLLNICKKHNTSINNEIHVSYDLSVKCCFDFLSNFNNTPVDNKYVAVNLRNFPEIYTKYNSEDKKNNINEYLIKFIKNLANKYSDYEIRLIPMHYFYIGEDDREFLNKIKFNINCTNITVQNKNLNLCGTLDVYKKADFTIGMRFHSVVFQTIVNRKNFILDYTGIKNGKIYSFVNDIDKSNFYKNRYVNLQNDNLKNLNVVNDEKIKDEIKIDKDYILKKMEVYGELI